MDQILCLLGQLLVIFVLLYKMIELIQQGGKSISWQEIGARLYGLVEVLVVKSDGLHQLGIYTKIL